MAVRFNAAEWRRLGISEPQVRLIEHMATQVGETSVLVLSLEDLYDLLASQRPASPADVNRLRHEVEAVAAQLPRRETRDPRPVVELLLQMVQGLSRRVSELERLRHRLDEIEKDYQWR